VRSKGRDVGAGGVTRFNETGSGVLISDSGKVLTAAHVVNGMDEITVEGIAGEVVRAKLISSDAAADISLLQRERVTAACGSHSSATPTRWRSVSRSWSLALPTGSRIR
jgi:S1-C subfamily serine protease